MTSKITSSTIQLPDFMGAMENLPLYLERSTFPNSHRGKNTLCFRVEIGGEDWVI